MNIDTLGLHPGIPQTNHGPSAADDEFALKLREAGEHFESMLLTDVFSKLRQSFSLEDTKDKDAGHDTLAGLADQSLCDAIAARGGLGLAAMITRKLATENL